MRTISKEELKELYDKDFPLWVEINLELLKEIRRGEVIKGRVVEVKENGLIVEIMEGVEGYVPKEEISCDGHAFKGARRRG